MKATLGLLLAVALLGGCAAKSQVPETPETVGQSAEPTAAVSIPPKVPKMTKAEPPVDDFQQVKAQGRVKVTGQCVELVTDQLTWTLIGPAAATLRDGERAGVVGVPDPDRETGCSGSPLLVSAATPL